METLASLEAMGLFTAPQQSLAGLDAEAAVRLIAATADVALVVDRDGVIRDVAAGSKDMAREGLQDWIGRAWVDTVTVESRPKIEALRDAAAKSGPVRWRQVNHPSAYGADIPVLYSAMQTDKDGRLVAIGRDLRAMAALQQRLVEAQVSLERDYERLRQVETRYRLLFQMATEAVLVVDASSQKILEANPAAGRMLGMATKRVSSKVFPDSFPLAEMEALNRLLAGVRATGRAEDTRVRLGADNRTFDLSASLFRQDNAAYFLIRLAPITGGGFSEIVVPGESNLMKIIEIAPEGFVVTDQEGRILTANGAFLDMAQLATVEQTRAEPLERWMGQPGINFAVLAANLREYGSVRNFASVLRGEYGLNSEVEISGVSVPNGQPPCFGFMIRSLAPRARPRHRGNGDLPRSVEQLTELVGRVPLKDLVRETTDVIERLCIEAALELTGDNRASAAEMLGLSRQSLYVKLRRYGLGDLASENED